jgi:hypothetical protein
MILEIQAKEGRSFLLFLKPPETPGILQIALPKEVPDMSIGDQYRWRLFYSCNTREDNQYQMAEATIERIDLPDKGRYALSQVDSLEERLSIYAENGLWHNLMTYLVDERMKDPDNKVLNLMWKDLLLQNPEVELGELSDQPIIDFSDADINYSE